MTVLQPGILVHEMFKGNYYAIYSSSGDDITPAEIRLEVQFSCVSLVRVLLYYLYLGSVVYATSFTVGTSWKFKCCSSHPTLLSDCVASIFVLNWLQTGLSTLVFCPSASFYLYILKQCLSYVPILIGLHIQIHRFYYCYEQDFTFHMYLYD